jgi:hypothetical protein
MRSGVGRVSLGVFAVTRRVSSKAHYFSLTVRLVLVPHPSQT